MDQTTNLHQLPWRHVHFIGVGGVGMSGQATILMDLGVEISGSDTVRSPGFDRLLRGGADVRLGHCRTNLPAEADLVVYSSAIQPTNPELQAAGQNGVPTLSRGGLLARLATFYECVIAVAGSHGKTTTTAMIAHLLGTAGLRPGFMVGGEVDGWGAPAAAGNGRILVTEVDESDGTQALMHSTVGVVLNIEDDHSWSVGGQEALETCFQTFAAQADRLVAWRTPATSRLLDNHASAQFVNADGLPPEVALRVAGRHNRTNASVALRVVAALGVPPATALTAIQTFEGVARRMSVRYEAPDGAIAVVEDYAHHPTELAAAIEALRDAYPEHALCVVFQPHRFERVKRYAKAFGERLGGADQVVVARPFAAWVDDQTLADPRQILEHVHGVPVSYWDGDWEGLAQTLIFLDGGAPRPRVFAVIGAGDIGGLVAPLRNRAVGAFMAATVAAVRQAVPGLSVDQSREWGALTSAGVGTARPWVIEPVDEEQLAAAVRVVCARGCSVAVLGSGTNMIGSDDCLPALVVRLNRGGFGRWSVEADRVVAGAGVNLGELSRSLLKAGLLPVAVAPLAWIPGTLGGAVRMNAGADGGTMSDWVLRVHGLDADGQPWTADRDSIAWRYRGSDIPGSVTITQVELRLRSVARAGLARRRYSDAGKARRGRQPKGRHAGSTFQNAGECAAGKLLDACGCKGMHEGACSVSAKHANFLVCDAGCREADVAALMTRLRCRVMSETGVRLRPEIVFANPATARAVDHTPGPLRVAVLAGGESTERVVSLASGRAVASALEAAGHDVALIVLEHNCLPAISPAIDVVFPALHGEYGEDGGVQADLEAAGIPYAGSGPVASALIMSKLASKACLVANGVRTPDYCVVESPAAPLPDLPFPLVVKPDGQGSSMGMTRLNKPSGWWRRALVKAFALEDVVFAEVFVAGAEITVGVLDGEPLPVVEVVPPSGRMFDYDAKYDHRHGHTQYLCPPRHVPADIQERARQVAVKAFNALGAKDMLRVDFIVDAEGELWALEANSIPGFTGTSLLPMAARAAGIGFPQLVAGLARRNCGRGVL